MPRLAPANTELLLYMLNYKKEKNATSIVNVKIFIYHLRPIVWIFPIKGVGHYTYGPDNKSISVHSGQILFIPSGCEHSLSGADKFITLHGFYIHPSVFARLSNIMQPTPSTRKLASGHDSSIPVRWTDDNHIFRSMQEIYEQCLAEYARNNEWKVPLFNAVSQLLAVMVVRLLNTKSVNLSSDSTMMRLLNTRSWIDRHFLDHITISELAKKLHYLVLIFLNYLQI